MVNFCVFPTPLGLCGLAWAGEVVVATSLPEDSVASTAARLSARTGALEGAPPEAVRRGIAAITALLEGERTDLNFIACDFDRVDAFAQTVYAATRAIPPGETATYGDIAQELGNRRLAQSVGRVLGRNPWPIIVPCHRVMGSDGRLTGFSARGGVTTKLRMLAIEGARIGDDPALFGALPLAVKPLA